MLVSKKALKIIALSFLPLLASLICNACASIPKLSKEEKQIITQVVKTPFTEIIKGETGFATAQGHSIWFESIQQKVLEKELLY